jgi:hypothetical protein
MIKYDYDKLSPFEKAILDKLDELIRVVKGYDDNPE